MVVSDICQRSGRPPTPCRTRRAAKGEAAEPGSKPQHGVDTPPCLDSCRVRRPRVGTERAGTPPNDPYRSAGYETNEPVENQMSSSGLSSGPTGVGPAGPPTAPSRPYDTIVYSSGREERYWKA